MASSQGIVVGCASLSEILAPLGESTGDTATGSSISLLRSLSRLLTAASADLDKLALEAAAGWANRDASRWHGAWKRIEGWVGIGAVLARGIRRV